MELGVFLLVTIFVIAIWWKSSMNLDRADKRVGLIRLMLNTAIIVVIFSLGGILDNICSIVALLSLALYSCMPIIHYITIKKLSVGDENFKDELNSRRDVIFAMHIMLLVGCCEIVVGSIFSFVMAAAIMYMGIIILSIVPIIQIIHYIKYGEGISKSSIAAVQETRFQEAFEYIRTILDTKIILIMVAILFSYMILSINYYAYISSGNISHSNTLLWCMLTLVIACVVLKEASKTTLINMWMYVRCVRQTEQGYMVNHDGLYEELQVEPGDGNIMSMQGSIILVIGESASRDYMHCYNDKFMYNNTPWLESKRSDNNFIIFNNAFSSYNTTTEVLKLALTKASQYNDYSFEDSASIIDVARKAGYKTYWISHQGKIAQESVATTMIAKTADYNIGVSTSSVIGYDKELLGALKSIDTQHNKKNFIVLHLMGSHMRYRARYPQKWTKYKDDTTEAYYANTIRYTDEFLQECIEYAKDNLNLQAMIYFSDHGENLSKGHHPSIKTADTVRIPMFVYVSDTYKELNPDRVIILRKNANKFYSNDMIYNTIIGMMNVRTDSYDGKEDISSNEYAYNRDNVLTFLGECLAKDL